MILFTSQYFVMVFEAIACLLLGYYAITYYGLMNESDSKYLKYLVIASIGLFVLNLFLIIANVFELFDYTPTKTSVELVYSIILLVCSVILVYSSREEDFDEQEQTYG
ncbi:Uncharacterised protein [uncultured archaeon]|nr:Uncharacterised protein [uncultured archaeon]